MALGTGNKASCASSRSPYTAEWRHSASQSGCAPGIELLGTDAVCKVKGGPGGRPFVLSVPRYVTTAEAADCTDAAGDGAQGAASTPPTGMPADSGPEHRGSYKPGEMLVKSALLSEPRPPQTQPPHSEAGPPAALPVLLGRTSLFQPTPVAAGKTMLGTMAMMKSWQGEVPAPTAATPAVATAASAAASAASQVGAGTSGAANAPMGAPWAAPPPGADLALGSPDCPTIGSRGHPLQCKPCAFVFKGGCSNGLECRFCHLCMPGEKKRRKKERKTIRREMAALRGTAACQRGQAPNRR
mmetsp:Transcript_31399/g.85184  ORF Transcript_31399/g.85184 Transcript_31399/m.85184 type:complete len:299 (-) Transcript_31399:93-989(-)